MKNRPVDRSGLGPFAVRRHGRRCVLAGAGLALALAACGDEASTNPPVPPSGNYPASWGTPPSPGEPGTAQRVDSVGMLSATGARLRFALVNVGQGDAIWIELPGNKAVALDGGPDRQGNYSDFVAARRAEGVFLDHVVLSHAHSDHYTGLSTSMAELPTDCMQRVFDPGLDRPDIPGYQTFRRIAGCRYVSTGKGMSLALHPFVSLEVVGVSAQPFPTGDSTGVNNTSAVVYLKFGRFAALLMGDAELDAEKRLLSDRPTQLRANVLKLGHHGSCSSTSTSLLGAVSPGLSLISAGSANDYGHPHCQTLTKLQNKGLNWLRTDTRGTIWIETDGDRWVATTQYPPRAEDEVCPRACASPPPDF